MSENCSVKRRNRTGLTLLELIVVIAILVVIAGILIPLLPDFLTKANQATSATNMAELDKAIMTFRATYNHWPNHYDSLLTEDGGLPELIPGPPNGANCLEARTLQKGQEGRLFTSGINMIYDLEDSDPGREGFHPTKFPYVASQATFGNGRPLSKDGGSTVAMLLRKNGTEDDTYDGLLGNVRLDPSHDYVVFGIGTYCTLCAANSLVKEAPIFNYPKDYNLSTPANSYMRVCAIFDVGEPNDNTGGVDARFVTCAGITTGGLYSSGDMIDAYIEKQFDVASPDD